MGKAIVSTKAGVNGLDVVPTEDFVLAETAEEMAAAITILLSDPSARSRLEANARSRVEQSYNWDAIARQQSELYSAVYPLSSQSALKPTGR